MKTIQYIILFIFLNIVTACNTEPKVKIIKLGHSLNETHPIHKAMLYMAKRLKEKSHGTLQIAVYSNSQLGSEKDCIELLQIGTLGMTKVSTGILENFAPRLKVLGLPFLFKNRKQRLNVLESSIGEELLNESVPNRLKGLTFYDAGSRSFYTKIPVNKPSDLNGLKFGFLENQTTSIMVKILGGSPTPISWGELYTALQRGIVDGAENSLPSFYLLKHYEVCKYYIKDEHTALPDELLISTIVWDKLSQQEQKWLKEAAMESSQYEKRIWREAELRALEEVKKAGVKVIDVERKPLREEVKPIYKVFEQDPKMKKTIKAIQAME